MIRSHTEASAPSRRGVFPDPSISYRIGLIEFRRFGRKLRGQDVWLILAGIGTLFLLISIPIIFGFARDFGRGIAEGDISLSMFATIMVVGWIAMTAFAIVSGVGSEGEVDNQDAILTIRPPKDVAGGLVCYVMAGYAPFVFIPAIAAGTGIAVGVESPLPLVGILLVALSILISAVLVGYALGIWLKGAIRRSPWLTRLKPILGIGVVVGYFWLSFAGVLWPFLTDVGSALVATPLGWLGDLALITTPGVEASIVHAIGAIALAFTIVPIGLLMLVRGAEYAWYVDREARIEEDARRGPVETPSISQRLDGILRRGGVTPATRGVAVVVLLRGYRAPLQLVFVAVPFLFLIPILDPLVRTGVVPEWMPWVVMLYGAWAAGAGFPLNILGNQGAVLPRVLTSPAGGRRVVHGHVLASALVFIPLTAGLSVGTGVLAGRSTSVLLAVGGASVAAVIAGCVLAAGIGVTFPRLTSVDLTASTEAVLPSKVAFALFSLLSALAASSVGILSDDLYRLVISALLSDVIPFGLTVSERVLEIGAIAVVIVTIVAIPVAYVRAVRCIENYRLT